MNVGTLKTKFFITMLFAALGIFLASCGTVSTGALGGVAGGGAPIDLQDVTTATDIGATEPPPTPIPPAAGHIVFVSDRDGDNHLYVMNADGSAQGSLTGGDDETPQLSLDGGRVAFVSTLKNNKDIFVYDFNTRNLFRVTDDPANDRAPSLSSDGSRVAFESFRDGNWEIYVANIDGSDLTRLTDDPSGDSSPVWSPDDSQIAFTSSRFGNTDVFLISPNGGTPSTLTTNPSPDSNPVWSPDGNTIAYLSYPSSDMANICIISRDAVNNQCVVQALGRNHAPAWLNNDEFAFLWERGDGNFGIDTFVISTSTLTTINSQFAPRGDPVASPDGIRIAFQAEVDGNMDIVEYLVLTGEALRLTNNPAFDGQPVWTGR